MRYASVFIAVGFVISCGRREDPDSSGAAPSAAPLAAHANSAQIDDTCRLCRGVAAPSAIWSGLYVDRACTRRAAALSTDACAIVHAAGTLDVYIAGERVPTRVVRQLSPSESGTLYRKGSDGCASVTDTRTPLDCEGKRVCRGTDGELACDHCRMIGTCPDYEGSRAILELAPAN